LLALSGLTLAMVAAAPVCLRRRDDVGAGGRGEDEPRITTARSAKKF
jgi:hypothetical protein